MLPSSGSGIYGGGAVGGVINIITKRNYSGGEIKLTYDNTFSSDTAKRRVDFTYGLTLEGGRTHAMIFASKADAATMTLQDRYGLIRGYYDRVAVNNPTFFLTNTVLLGTTPRITSSGGVPLVLKAAYGGQTLSSSFVFVPAGYQGLATDGTAALVANAGRLDPAWPDTPQHYNGLRAQIYPVPETKSIRAEVRRQMFPGLEAYVSFSYDHNGSVPEIPVTGFGFNTVSLAAANPLNPFNQAVTVMIPTDEVLHNRTIFDRRQFTGGVSLKLPHEWQALADYAWTGNDRSILGYVAASAKIAADVTAGVLDPLRDRLRTTNSIPLSYYTGTITSNPKPELTEVSLRAAGPLGKIFSLQPTLAVGARSETEKIPQFVLRINYPNSPANDLANLNLSLRQRVDSYFAELTIPLIAREKSRVGLRLLELQVTGRRDEYTFALEHPVNSTATSTPFPAAVTLVESEVSYRSTKPTYGLRYKPVEDVMLRVAFAQGFVPPGAFQLIPGIPSTFASTVLDPRRGGASTAVIPNPVGGNPNVTPETSENWTAGVVFTPKAVPGLRFAIDYTHIKKNNNITTLSAQQIVDNEAIFPGRVTRGPVPVGDTFGVGTITGIDTTTLNLFSTAVEAYDISLGYQKTTATMGTFSVDALATVTEHYLQRIALGAPLLDYVGTPNNGGPLKFRGNLAVTWSRGPWQAGWTATYYGGYKITAAPFTTLTTFVLSNGGPTVPSQIYHDVFVGYRFGAAGRTEAKWHRLLDRTELLVGVRNVFNKAPAFDGGAGPSSWFLSPYGDVRLASYYLSLKRSF